MFVYCINMLTLIQVHNNKKDTQDTQKSRRRLLICRVLQARWDRQDSLGPAGCCVLQARWDRQDMQNHMAPPLYRGKRAKNFSITSRAPLKVGLCKCRWQHIDVYIS